MRQLKFKRLIIKLTGEAFTNLNVLKKIAKEIIDCSNKKFDLAIVVGGGNFFRGRDVSIEDKLITDRAGMLGTVINGIVLEQTLTQIKSNSSKHLSALGINGIVEKYTVELAQQYFTEQKILIFSAGTGLPYFTTDTAVALRACELNADLILKATNVSGIYSQDPNKYQNAQLIKKLSYEEALKRELKIIDQQAFALLKEAKIPIIVFNIFKHGNLKKVLAGDEIGSMIC